jgi:hypothetical protein
MEKIPSRSASLSVIISILGGIFIISGGLSLFAMLSWHGATLMMGGPLHMYDFTYPYWLTALMATISLLAGGSVLFASYKMYKEPKNNLWGFMITVGSLVSLFAIGGYGLGGIVGLMGGVMGLTRSRREV